MGKLALAVAWVAVFGAAWAGPLGSARADEEENEVESMFGLVAVWDPDVSGAPVGGGLRISAALFDLGDIAAVTLGLGAFATYTQTDVGGTAVYTVATPVDATLGVRLKLGPFEIEPRAGPAEWLSLSWSTTLDQEQTPSANAGNATVVLTALDLSIDVGSVLWITGGVHWYHASGASAMLLDLGLGF